jgi:hypothetical protein
MSAGMRLRITGLLAVSDADVVVMATTHRLAAAHYPLAGAAHRK